MGRGTQRKIREKILGESDVGPLLRGRYLNVGETQSMVFLQDDPPPIFDPTAPQHAFSVAAKGKIPRTQS